MAAFEQRIAGTTPTLWVDEAIAKDTRKSYFFVPDFADIDCIGWSALGIMPWRTDTSAIRWTNRGDKLTTFQKFVIAIVLLLTGLIAGLQTLMIVGILPAIVRMPLATYAGMWQSLDHFMAVRMPILVNVTFFFYLVAIVLFVRSRSKGMVWTLLGCFALLVTDTVFTVTQQSPINHAVQALNLSQLNDLSRVQQLRDATVDHFHLRSWLSICAFVWLVFVTVFSFGGQQIQPSGGEQS